MNSNILLVGRITTKNTATGKEKEIGYRIAILENSSYGLVVKSINELSAQETAKLIVSNRGILNATIKEGKVHGTNGSLERYPSNDRSGNESSIIIISRLKDGFKCCNAFGVMRCFTNKEAVAFCKLYGISNGKVTTISGTETISCISGNYIEEDISVKDLVTGKSNSDNGFYKALVDACGKERANILFYLVKEKNVGVDGIKALISVGENGIALAGLICYKKGDEELRGYISKIVEPKVMDIVEKMITLGYCVDDYWDAPVVFPYVKGTNADYDINCNKLYSCIGNMMVDKNTNIDGTQLTPDIRTYFKDVTKYELKDELVLCGYNPLKGVVVVAKEDHLAVKED